MCRRMLFRLLTWAMHTLEHSSVLLLGASLPDVHPWNLQQEALCISDNLQRGPGHKPRTSPWQEAGQDGTAERYCQSSSCTEVHGCFLTDFLAAMMPLDLRQPILHFTAICMLLQSSYEHWPKST